MKLTLEKLVDEAKIFAKQQSNTTHQELLGTNDGKAIGTYIERKFKNYLKKKYNLTIGSSSKGIDLPDSHINTDIKVTSIKRPQSSAPFNSIEQKIYGLGHNLLIFVYEKTDLNYKCYLDFKHIIFITSEHTGDYTLTKKLREMLKSHTSESEIINLLEKKNIPGDENNLKYLAKKILVKPPKQGYLTISNALQWRLKYGNIFNSGCELEGVYKYDKI